MRLVELSAPSAESGGASEPQARAVNVVNSARIAQESAKRSDRSAFLWNSPIPAFRLIELDYPADLYLDSVKEETEHPPLRMSKRWIMIHRTNYRVRQSVIDRRQWQVLRRLRDGMALGDAIDEVSRRHRPRLTETELFSWFRQWTAIGLFSGVSLPGD